MIDRDTLQVGDEVYVEKDDFHPAYISKVAKKLKTRFTLESNASFTYDCREYPRHTWHFTHCSFPVTDEQKEEVYRNRLIRVISNLSEKGKLNSLSTETLKELYKLLKQAQGDENE